MFQTSMQNDRKQACLTVLLIGNLKVTEIKQSPFSGESVHSPDIFIHVRIERKDVEIFYYEKK